MIDPAVKTAMALCVLLGGVCVALLFRHDSPQPGGSVVSSAARGSEQLLIRRRADGANSTLATEGNGRRRRTSADNASSAVGESQPTATVVTPLDRRESPPQLAESYPEPNHTSSSSWGLSMNMLVPVVVGTDETDRTHRIVDGDTLSALARRYLGSAARANEIFEANRSVLSDPELLPIGGELKIPPRDKRSGTTQPAVSSG